MALTDYTIAMLNTVRADASALFQSKIPVAEQATFGDYALALSTYDAQYNEFTGLLVKVAMQIVKSSPAQRLFERFVKGTIPTGGIIEENFVVQPTATDFDPTGANVLARVKPTIISRYQYSNRDETVKISTAYQQVNEAVTTGNIAKIGSLFEAIVSNIMTEVYENENILVKELLATYDGYSKQGVTAISNAATATEFLRVLRTKSLDMTFRADTFNKAGVKTKTPLDKQVLLINKDASAFIDVSKLSDTFNMGKADIQISDILWLDDFGSLADVTAILCSADFLEIWENYEMSGSIYNPAGGFTNTFYTIKQTLRLSEFENAVLFTTSDPVITPPVITP